MLAFSGCKKNEPIDEAKAEGKTTADFPQITADIFKPMDGGIRLSPEEIMGRNTWNLWSAGNQNFWNRAAQDSYGLMDLLKMLDNRKFPRSERFSDGGHPKPYGYVSPSLDGIWLRAPYLHNGSVPTLRDLLNPPNERPQSFHRGYDVFDPVKVGFKEPPPRATGPNGELTQPYFLFDTREKGNGNQGHTYGTQLSNEDKEKLLEYLKML